MATGQTILDLMEDLNGELQLQSGESNVAMGLRMINAAQDLMEAVMATHPNVGYSAIGTVTTAASTESTAFPTGLIRLDSLWYIDPDTSRPGWKLDPIRIPGGHALGKTWLSNLAYTNSTGKPRAYWTNATNIYWNPLPDAVHTVRWYGLAHKADVTAGGTFAYDDALLFPVAVLASRFVKTSLDDPPESFISLARDLFDPVIEALSNFQRDGAHGMVYEERHDT